jgi:uncharacterized protein (UPF0332 family)
MTEKELAIKLKIDKARALMNEVEILTQNNFYNTAVSRLYYSCFHATRALLLTKDLITKTHSGVASNLHKYFVVTGNFDEKHASFFARLMKERIEDDYNDFIIKDFEEIAAYIQPAKEYLSYVIAIINKQIKV